MTRAPLGHDEILAGDVHPVSCWQCLGPIDLGVCGDESVTHLREPDDGACANEVAQLPEEPFSIRHGRDRIAARESDVMGFHLRVFQIDLELDLHPSLQLWPLVVRVDIRPMGKNALVPVLRDDDAETTLGSKLFHSTQQPWATLAHALDHELLGGRSKVPDQLEKRLLDIVAVSPALPLWPFLAKPVALLLSPILLLLLLLLAVAACSSRCLRLPRRRRGGRLGLGSGWLGALLVRELQRRARVVAWVQCDRHALNVKMQRRTLGEAAIHLIAVLAIAGDEGRVLDGVFQRGLQLISEGTRHRE
mmetsp:Transcript_15470/g.41762  ORF Transcript_15470/g.41762 Transcript_15470/m.41762 type:complete len:305 (-) Transcript_15470:1250-2164(-)